MSAKFYREKTLDDFFSVIKKTLETSNEISFLLHLQLNCSLILQNPSAHSNAISCFCNRRSDS